MLTLTFTGTYAELGNEHKTYWSSATGTELHFDFPYYYSIASCPEINNFFGLWTLGVVYNYAIFGLYIKQ